jgi:hypothetical protein
VTNGQTYTVAVKMTTSDYYYPIPIEYKITQTCDPTIQTGVSYARHGDTDTWADLAPDYNACLRARVQEGTVSVSVSPSSVEYGIVALGTSQDTVTLNQQITVTNNGGITEDFSIKSSDATRVGGTTWELVTGTPGANEFKHEFSTNGTDWTTMPADNDYATLANSIETDSDVTVYLRITMPSSTPDALEHTLVVTIMALESG